MKVDMENINSVSGFYVVDREVFTQTLDECNIQRSFELGGGLVVHLGSRCGTPIWLLNNPHGERNAIWVDDAVRVHE
jgi:hypothetical protein